MSQYHNIENPNVKHQGSTEVGTFAQPGESLHDSGSWTNLDNIASNRASSPRNPRMNRTQLAFLIVAPIVFFASLLLTTWALNEFLQ